jgi:uncharacterized lipoprotein YddW (UPF0748 family)
VTQLRALRDCQGALRWPRALLIRALFLLCTAASFAGEAEMRGLWVDAWGDGFLSAGQTSKLLADCRAYHFNAIFVQMRRRADAFYLPHSPNQDPRTTALSPEYDALADLVAKAHSGTPRVEVHCWVTANLVWSSANPPPQPSHVVNQHPEFLMKNFAGDSFLAEGYYLDPGNPEAMQWNYEMAMDIARHYEIDGFHWDYIRYPQQDAGYNERALQRYQQEFNTTLRPAPTDTRFSIWRRRQVSDFLRWVDASLLEINPRLVISAAVIADRSDAFNARFQDWNLWNAEGLIDLCIPMNYSANSTLFLSRLNDAAAYQGIRRVYMGQGAYLNQKEQTLEQFNEIRGRGLLGGVFYSYRTPNSGTIDAAGTFSLLESAYQPDSLPTPDLPWKNNVAIGNLKCRVLASADSKPLYNASVTINISPVKTGKTGPHGVFAFFDLPVGSYAVTAFAQGLGSVTNTVIVSAGRVATADFLIPDPARAPVIASLWKTKTNTVQILVEGTKDARYHLLASPDLSDWFEITNLLAPAETFKLEDPRPADERRFYRAEQRP